MDFAGLFAGLTQIAGDTVASMPLRCYVEALSLVSDGKSGKRQEWTATTDEPLPCDLVAESGKTHVAGDVPKAQTAVTVVFKGNVAVTGEQRIRVLAYTTESGTVPEMIVSITHVLPNRGVITEVVGLVQI
jgi:hypothetical protein